MLEEVETDDLSSEFSGDEEEEPVELNETFTKECSFPGNVKIVVQSTTFWLVQFSVRALTSLGVLRRSRKGVVGHTKRSSSSLLPSSRPH